MIWKVLTNKEQGWIFFKMDEREQESFLNNDKTVIVNIRYLGVDKRVIDKIVDRIEKNPTELYKSRQKRGYEKSKPKENE